MCWLLIEQVSDRNTFSKLLLRTFDVCDLKPNTPPIHLWDYYYLFKFVAPTLGPIWMLPTWALWVTPLGKSIVYNQTVSQTLGVGGLDLVIMHKMASRPKDLRCSTAKIRMQHQCSCQIPCAALVSELQCKPCVTHKYLIFHHACTTDDLAWFNRKQSFASSAIFV